MAQISNKFQIVRGSGMTGAGWTAVTVPIPTARRVTVHNTDAAAAMDICTDTDDATAVLELAAGESLEIEVWRGSQINLQSGETVFFVKGAGAQPLLTFEA